MVTLSGGVVKEMSKEKKKETKKTQHDRDDEDVSDTVGALHGELAICEAP